jgi:hypothetical protein
MRFYLKTFPGPLGVGQVFRLDEGSHVSVGRHARVDLQLQDQAVSRWHCQLWVHGSRVWVRDTNSRNGTWCGTTYLGHRFEPYEARAGDVLRFGPVQMVLHTSPGIGPDVWEASQDPIELLRFLPGRGSKRILRLFAVACCRELWPGLSEPASREAIEIAQGYADGLRCEESLEEAHAQSFAVVPSAPRDQRGPALAAYHSTNTSSAHAARLTWDAARDAGLSTQRACDIVRDMLGDFFHPVAIPYAWRQWEEKTVVKIAETIYQEHAFSDMPILADALEDAGCTDRVVIDHCRSHGPHVRGCWLLDAILDRR